MDDSARLRRTIRRCTAVLVTAVGFTGLAIVRGRGAGESLALLLVFGSLLYLAVEFVRNTPTQFEDSEETSGSSGAETVGESQ
jgi:hypothetical protein